MGFSTSLRKQEGWSESKVQRVLKQNPMNRQNRQAMNPTEGRPSSKNNSGDDPIRPQKKRQPHNLARAQNQDRTKQHNRDLEVAAALRPDNSLGLVNVANVVAYVANAFVSYGIGTFGLFGFSTNAEVSATFQSLVTPASWTFLIWIFIFAFQLAWAIAQLLSDFRKMPLVTTIGWNYVIVCVFQIAWTITFCMSIIWASMIGMIGILGFLFRIFSAQSNLPAEHYLYWALKFPMTLHYGWIIAATVVNVNVMLVSLGIEETMQFYIALGSLSTLMLVACATSDLIVLLVLAWATVRGTIRCECSLG